MENTHAWGDLFAKWPEDMPHRGVAITTFGEQIAFDGFMRRGELLLLNRRAPDTVGARQVIVPLVHLAGVKITDVIKSSLFEKAGFVGALPKT